MQATKVFIVRHGETYWNVEGRIQGHDDSPLTEIGITQAESLAKRLRDYQFAAIYSSDLPRAQETAQHIANRRKNQSIILKPCLRERNFGILQGIVKKDLQKFFPEESTHYENNDPDHIIPDGESLRTFRQRCVDCLEDLVSQHENEVILVVAHSGVLRSIFKHTFNLPFNIPRYFEMLNASVNVFLRTREHWVLETWGDMGHLQHIRALDDIY